MLSARSLTKAYNGFVAVRDATFQVPQGETFGLLGSNGAGKTTLMKIFGTLLHPDRGTATVRGVDVRTHPLEVRRIVGYLPETPALYDHLTGYEFLDMLSVLRGIPRDDAEARIGRVAKTFRLDRELDTEMGSHSKGMRQKVAVASALFHEPPVLILDEPTTGLDPRFSKILKDYLRGYVREGGTVLMSTHITEVAEALCDRVAIIHEGTLRDVGTLPELEARYGADTLEDVFVAAVGEA